MAVTLNEYLEEQLETETRKPIIELISEPSSGQDIPFIGSPLSSIDVGEEYPHGINYIDGSYVEVHSRRVDANFTHLFMFVSDTARSVWNAAIPLTFDETKSTVHYEYPSIVELSSGGGIGIIVTQREGGVSTLRYMVVDKLGAITTALTDMNTTGVFYESGVIKWSDGSYFAVATRKNGTTWEMIKFTHAAGGTWSTWSAGASLAISNQADDTLEKRRPFLYEADRTTGGVQQWLYWDRVDQETGLTKNRNVYSAHVTDFFASSPAATKRTTYSNMWEAAERPTMAQVTLPSDSAFYAYAKRSVSVLLNHQSTPAIGNSVSSALHELYYDASSDYIIVVFTLARNGVYVIDADTLTIVKQYQSVDVVGASSPPLQAYELATARASSYSDGRLALTYTSAVSGDPIVEVININDQTVKTIFGKDASPARVAAVPGSLRWVIDGNGKYPSTIIEGCFVDPDVVRIVSSSSLFELWSVNYTGLSGDVVGTLVGSLRPSYLGAQPPSITNDFFGNFGGPRVAWDRDTKRVYVALHSTCTTISYPTQANREGCIIVADYETAATIEIYRKSAIGSGDPYTAGFPATGAIAVAVYGGLLVYSIHDDIALFPAEPTGIGVIQNDLVTQNFIGAPVGGTRDYDSVGQIEPFGDGRFMLSTYTGGMGIYNPASNTADSVFTYETIIGMPQNEANGTVAIRKAVYDSTRNRIYQIHNQTFTPESDGLGSTGLLAYDLDGDIIRSYYGTITDLGGTPTFTAPGILTTQTEDSYPFLMRNGDGTGLAAFWQRRFSGSREDLYFDEEIENFDLLPYLVEELAWMHTLNNSPNTMNFNVSNASLFDPTNLSSIHRNKLDRGRRIILNKGERTPTGDLLIQEWEGYVHGGSHTYSRGSVSDRSIQMYDLRKPLESYKISASPPYGHGPDVYDVTSYPALPDGSTGILYHIATVVGMLDTTKVVIPAFSNSSPIKAQMTDMTLMEMFEIIAARFQRVPFVNKDGQLTVKEISKTAPVDHTIDDAKLIISISPKESEADDTNRVTVRGVLDDELDVTYPEQILLEPSGVVGWLMREHDEVYVPYSPDYSVTAVNPRIKVILWDAPEPYPRVEQFRASWAMINRTIGGDGAAPAGATATEAAEFYNSHGVRINMNVYRKWIKLISLIVSIVGYALIVAGVLSLFGNLPIIGGFFNSKAIQILAAAVFVLNLIVIALSGLWFYQLQVFASPTGKVKKEIQASANDLDKQQRMNGIIVEKIEDFALAHTVAVCQTMADWFLLIVQLADRPITIRMMGHLKYEPGDTIRFVHPKGGQYVKCLIWEIRHTMRRGDGTDGYDTQEMDVMVVPS